MAEVPIPYAEHMHGTRRVGEWARRAGVHRSRLRREVLRATGVNPQVALHRTHVERAIRLYVGGMRLAEAAAVVGFPDEFTLSDQCVRYLGARPTELRRTHGD